MGCLKLYQDREGLEKSSVFFRETLGKKGGQEKNRVNYYPFGFVMNSYTSNGEKYRFGYQGDFAEDDTEETGFNHFEARQYDPRIGRWMVVDPYRQFASPYIGMGNNPIYFVDPDGGCVDENGNIIADCNGGESNYNGFHTVVVGDMNWDDVVPNGSKIQPGSTADFVFMSGLTSIERAFVQNPSLNSGTERWSWTIPYQKPYWFNGSGVGVNGMTPLGGVSFSFDRIQTSDGNNDLYVNVSYGLGLDVSAEVHGIRYRSTNGDPLTSSQITGFGFHYGLGMGSVSGTQSHSLSFANGGFREVGRGTQLGLGAGVTAGHAAAGYTLNFSKLFR